MVSSGPPPSATIVGRDDSRLIDCKSLLTDSISGLVCSDEDMVLVGLVGLVGICVGVRVAVSVEGEGE